MLNNIQPKTQTKVIIHKSGLFKDMTPEIIKEALMKEPHLLTETSYDFQCKYPEIIKEALMKVPHLFTKTSYDFQCKYPEIIKLVKRYSEIKSSLTNVGRNASPYKGTRKLQGKREQGNNKYNNEYNNQYNNPVVRNKKRSFSMPSLRFNDQNTKGGMQM